MESKKRHENRTRQLKQSRQLLKRALTHTRSTIFYETRKKKHKTAMPFSIPDDGDAASQHMCESSDHRQSKFIAIQHVRKSQSKA